MQIRRKISSIFCLIMIFSCVFTLFSMNYLFINLNLNQSQKLPSIPIQNSALINGMYINHLLTFSGMGSGLSSFVYSQISANLFHVSWNNWIGLTTWDVDTQTRVVSNMAGVLTLGDGNHDPSWIFTNVLLGNTVLIAVDGEGDHSFNVTGQLTAFLPGCGAVDVWVLQDLTLPTSRLWYEKTSGILLNGTFYYSGGTYYYSFAFVNTSIQFQPNNYPPTLSGGSVTPGTGTQTTQFNFRVNYTDRDNNQPFYTNVLINKTPYPMIKQNPADNNYTNGCLYQYLTYLQPGTYNYSFICNDGSFSNSTITYMGLIVSSSANTHAPILYNGRVYPDRGSFGITLFQFSVNYTDADNNAPTYINVKINSTGHSMQKQNPLDSNFIDGCIYEFSTELSLKGHYVYFFNCSDGNYPVNLGPFSGPLVESPIIFNGLYINHTFEEPGYGSMPSNFTYSNLEGHVAKCLWNLGGYLYEWDEDLQTRTIINSTTPIFNIGSHTPVWIFTSTKIGDSIPIAGASEGDHTFNVTRELVYLLPRVGPIEVWELRDLTLPGGMVWYEKSTGLLLNGTFYVMGGAFSYIFKFINTNANFTIVGNNYAPELTSGSVNPSTGNQSTLFNFNVIFTDQDNYPPVYIRVLINGTPWFMTKQNPLDVNYSDGCLYQYMTYLQPGNYSYSFECADWTFYNSTKTYTGLTVSKYNLNPPLLTNGQVNPQIGYAGITPFVFSINYTDTDNNAPSYVDVTIKGLTYSMVPQNPLDTNYKDGCIYQYTRTLTNGTYNYYFNCSDGTYLASAGPYSGPFSETQLLWNETRLNGIRIGTVITHGEDNPRTIYPQIIAELIQRGATITDISSTITSTILSNFDIIWFDEYGSAMTTAEIDAIEQWVQNGGRFIITGDNMGSAINLVQRFNISYGASPASGTTTDIYPHPITLNVKSIYFPSPMSSLNIASQPNAILCVKLTTYNMVVAMEFGGGAFVIIVDEDVLGSYTMADNHLLINNSFGWLSHIVNNYGPTLTAPSVIPNSGFPSTEFKFTVTYSDLDNNGPQLIRVLINKTLHSMQKQNPADKDYTDGCIYQYQTYLLPGVYNYSFECSDGKFYNSTPTYFGLNVSKRNLNPPTLTAGQVNPGYGFAKATNFVFKVNYTDKDNNPPINVNVTINSNRYIMNAQNPLDTNYMDGCIFQFSTILTSGTYNYFFNCSDGTYRASAGPYSGPIVEENPLQNYTMIPYYSYQWVDATGGIRCSMAGADDAAQQFYFPFIFKFYNLTFNSFYVCTNGYVSFVYRTSFSNVPFPSSTYTYMIAPYWDDLRAANPCNIFVRNLTAPNRVVVEWQNYYTLGGSLVGTFEIILFETGDIIFNYDYLSYASSYTCGLNLGINTLYFNSYTGLTASMDNFSIQFMQINNKYPPTLTSESVYPLKANQNTLFNFSVIYSDPENFSPAYINVLINGTPHSMTRQNPADSNFKDGCTYQCLTYLLPGIYTYSFECSDGKFTNSTMLYAGLNVTRINEQAPILTAGCVNPNKGYSNLTIFTFSVNYTDVDNNPPLYMNIIINSTSYPLSQQNPLDINYMDGTLFVFNTPLNIGTYVYSFSCSDGVHLTSNGPYNGPSVELTVRWNKTRLDGDRIGFVVAHGEQNPRVRYPAIARELIQRGATLNNITTTINSSLLTNFDLIWIDEGGSAMTAAEIDAIEQWVQYGGSLLLTGDNMGSALNLVQRFNISYGASAGTGMATAIYLHPITIGVKTIYFPAAAASLITSAQQNAFLCAKLNNYNLVVAMEFGSGAFVIIADDDLLFSYTLANNHILINNTFGWLCRLKNHCAPTLRNINVNPLVGTQSTLFSFTVTYTDLDNNAPISLNILINGTLFPMQKLNPADNNYSDGCVYRYMTFLIPGNYSYSFECFDGRYHNSTSLYTGLSVIEIKSPPTPLYWIWFLLIGAAIASIISSVVVVQRRKKKQAFLPLHSKSLASASPIPEAKTELVVLSTKEKILEEKSIKKGVKQEVTVQSSTFYCQKCRNPHQIANPLASIRYSCPNCEELLIRILNCPICNKSMPITQEHYLSYLGKTLLCPNCNKNFTLIDKPEILPTVKKEEREEKEVEQYKITYLKFDPQQFNCPACLKEIKIENPAPNIEYRCQDCNNPLEHLLKCPNCGFKMPFKHDNYSYYSKVSIECPECKRHQQEEEIRQIASKLKDPNKEVRIKTAEFLGEIGNKVAGPPLIATVLTDQDDDVRAVAITALGMTHATLALPLLKRLMAEDQNPELRKRAAQAVQWLNESDNLK